MMLGKKYTFETKNTRIRRLLISGVFLFVLAFGFIASFIVYIPIYAKMQKGRAAGAFYQKSPDAIAVFTGDKGRISYALELLKNNPSSKLFISGVYAANSFKTLLDKQTNPITGGEVVNNVGMQVDLDYESKNTFENVRETVAFLKRNNEFNKVLIISSDYHIMRINLIISHEMSGKTPEFYFDSVTNSYTEWKNIKKLLKEAVKITRTFFLMNVMREKVVSEED
jgi:uncharacterized SAM-binding protein YcdF (DUF218 family)